MMKRNFVTALFAITLCVSPITAEAKNPLVPHNAPASFADTVENLLPAVVNISTTQKIESMPHLQEIPDMPQFPEGSPFEDFFEEFMHRRGPGMEMQPEASLGSGFVIDAEKGYIVTNYHVIRDAEDIQVTFQDEETLEATLIGNDEKTDLAVLQVKTKKKLTAIEFGDSDVLRVGDWIIAIGNPFGLGGTVTAGIVSARARDINAGPYDDFIQTDASINRGNSGGPMFNVEGKIIGINTAIFSPSGGSVGIGFAIPSALAQPVIDQIIKYGRTRRGWLGVRIQQVTDEIAESLGLKKTTGALVASVTKDGPAEAAGLKAGDIILKFNGQKVSEMRELPRIVAETPIESAAKVTYWRDGKEHTSSVKIGELEKAEEDGLLVTGSKDIDEPEEEENGTEIDAIGLALQPLTSQTRRTYGIDSDITGTVVTNITQGSEAAQKGLYEGDVIVEINQQPIDKPETAVKAIEKAEKAGRNSVLLLINREGDSRFLALKLKKKTEE